MIVTVLEKQLVVKTSTIPGAGKGLFTKKDIAKGVCILEYTGTITSWANADYQDGDNPYLYYFNDEHVIDASPFPKVLARYPNDARGLGKVKGITNNCKFIEEGDRVFLETTKKIAAGDEVLVGYGKGYWDTVKSNIKIAAKEKTTTAKKAK